MTGQSTRPPTTLASAPSIPATTMMRFASGFSYRDCSRLFVVNCLRKLPGNSFINLHTCAGRKHIIFTGNDMFHNLYHLFSGLAHAENDLWKTTANLAMAVYLGKTDVFVRQFLDLPKDIIY